jgi:hypothetical protein
LQLRERLPRKWPFVSPLGEPELPPPGTVVEAHLEDDRGLTSCTNWLVETYNGFLLSMREGASAPANVICIDEGPNGIALYYSGPDGDSPFASVDSNREVTLENPARTLGKQMPDSEQSPTLYWLFVNETGTPTLPPPNHSVSFTTSLEQQIIVFRDGSVAIPGGHLPSN